MSAESLRSLAADEDLRAGLLGVDRTEQIWTEEQHQVRLIGWAAEGAAQCPELLLLMHCPSGGKREQRVSRRGVRYSPEAARLKRMGTRPGYPDLLLDVPAHGLHGLRCASS